MPLPEPSPPSPMPAYLAALNPEQRAAVEAVGGPVLVLAGAGTGKTRVLTTRIAHILHGRHAYPGQILAVTFTNKASREMGERVQHLLWGPAPETENETKRGPLTWLGTFHSIAARILRRHPEAVGLTSSFTILDTDDQIRVIKALLAERNIDEKQAPAKQFLARFSGWKDLGLTPERVTPVQLMNQHPRCLELYKAYQARLGTLNACDFGDLLLHNITLFQLRPELLADYAQRFKYILVDEYQDTNVAQYLWLRLLAAGHHNICCVGDDDQSIYGWRGAEVGNILKFEKDFPGATVVRLERNYRSTAHILAAASALIGHNKGRLGKTLWTEQEGGEKLQVHAVWDDAEEARHIGEEIETLQRKGCELREMAVLVRAGFQTRAFEERFLTLGLAYRVVGGLRFYERQEIRDAIAYLRVVFSKEDDLAFERIVNTPKRGIGKATLESLFLRARADGISLYDATRRSLDGKTLKGKVAGTLSILIAQFEQWRHEAGQLPLPVLVEKLLDESGYRAMWQAEKTPEAQGRLENLKELVRALGEFEDMAMFLEHVGLVAERAEEKGADMISLMTLHAAKGLEFKAVFLPGWEEGLFPHQRALDESGASGLEEERRLAYVGITRARERLFITHAASRRIYNQWQSSVPSRFLKELPPEHLEGEGEQPLHRRGGGGMFGGGRRDLEQEISRILAGHMGYPSSWKAEGNASRKEEGNLSWKAEKHASRKAEDAASQSPSAIASRRGLGVGMRVFHLKFGYGRITQINGEHLDIDFEKAGSKKVMSDYVEKG